MAGCLEAVRGRDHQMLSQQASLVRGRCMRLIRVIQCGMVERRGRCTTDQLESVNQAITELRNKGLSVCLSVCLSICPSYIPLTVICMSIININSCY